MPGDPNCPICHGVGFVHRDLPLDDPNFGRLQVCTCRQLSVAREGQQRLYRLSNLEALKSMTFETFKIQGRLGLGEEQVKSLTIAYNQALNFSQNLKGWLLLIGGYGVGKTHLAAAIANFAVSLGVPTLFLMVSDLLDWLRYTYDSPEATFEDRFEEIRNIRLLVLDDLGAHNDTPWAQEKLFQILNYRYLNRLPTIITSNEGAEGLDGRIRSRLQDPEMVTPVRISAPDYRNPVGENDHPQLSSLHLHGGQTFGNFSMREREKLKPDEAQSLEKAFRGAQRYAETPRGWIVFAGASFCGKTHLAASIGNYRHSSGEMPLFVEVAAMLDHLRAAFSPSSAVPYDERFNQIQTARLLILDDLGTESATPWAREKVYQLFNYRYFAELPTVITTVLRIEEIDPRLRNRMLDARLCTVYGITAPAYYPGQSAAEKPRRTLHKPG